MFDTTDMTSKYMYFQQIQCCHYLSHFLSHVILDLTYEIVTSCSRSDLVCDGRHTDLSRLDLNFQPELGESTAPLAPVDQKASSGAQHYRP
jgi:hypothetical protein